MNLVKKTLLQIELFLKNILSFFFKRIFLSFYLKVDHYKLPIYIISYNRLSFLKQTVDWLRSYGYKNINIIDNHSDYQPLLDYYRDCGCNVIRMKKNYGHLVFHKHFRFFFIRNFTFYVLSDPDLTPIKECPPNFIEVFFKVMQNNLGYSKVGFSLKLDDLPDDYYLKEEVLLWESKFYKHEIGNTPVKLYDANIDTTFAINSPKIFVAYLNRYKGVRTGVPYQVRHLPWYGEKESDELIHYQQTLRKDVSNWNGNISKERMQKRIKKHM